MFMWMCTNPAPEQNFNGWIAMNGLSRQHVIQPTHHYYFSRDPDVALLIQDEKLVTMIQPVLPLNYSSWLLGITTWVRSWITTRRQWLWLKKKFKVLFPLMTYNHPIYLSRVPSWSIDQLWLCVHAPTSGYFLLRTAIKYPGCQGSSQFRWQLIM